MSPSTPPLLSRGIGVLVDRGEAKLGVLWEELSLEVSLTSMNKVGGVFDRLWVDILERFMKGLVEDWEIMVYSRFDSEEEARREAWMKILMMLIMYRPAL